MDESLALRRSFGYQRIFERFEMWRAKCKDEPVEVFFDRSQAHYISREFCQRCRVRTQCYLMGVHGGYTGLWGGVWIGRDAQRGGRKSRASRLYMTALAAAHFMRSEFGIVIDLSKRDEIEVNLMKAMDEVFDER